MGNPAPGPGPQYDSVCSTCLLTSQASLYQTTKISLLHKSKKGCEPILACFSMIILEAHACKYRIS